MKNSLFANNQDLVFNTERTVNSKTTFDNCTFANNGFELCFFAHPSTPSDCDTPWVSPDTAVVNFNNCIITGDWSVSSGSECSDCGCFYPNYTVNFTNTLFDTLHTAPSGMAKGGISDMTGTTVKTIDVQADSANAMQVLSVADVQRFADHQSSNLVLRYDAEKQDSAQNPLLYDFRLQDGSPAINTGDTTGLHLTTDATDLAGERRLKQYLIDRGCYEYGTFSMTPFMTRFALSQTL